MSVNFKQCCPRVPQTALVLLFAQALNAQLNLCSSVLTPRSSHRTIRYHTNIHITQLLGRLNIKVIMFLTYAEDFGPKQFNVVIDVYSTSEKE